MEQFAWDPESYQALMAEAVPSYQRLQDELLAAVAERTPSTVLDLGIGSGLTALRVANALPTARIIGIDESQSMLAAAALTLDPQRTQLRRARLEDPLPTGPFDVVMSTLAVHHLDGPAKADLFQRIASALSSRGRFVLADLIVPENPDDVVTAIDGIDDTPSSLGDQRAWLHSVGFTTQVRWQYRDLAVLLADLET